MESSHGFQKGQVHSRKHKLSKKYFWRWSSPGPPPAGLKDHKIRAVDRRCHARNTCTLHLQNRLSGRRNFFTVIVRRKKNCLLLCSWMEVDDRVNVSNHYSKKHDARHSCTFAKALKTPQRPLARIRRKQASYTVWSLKTKSQDPFCWNHRMQTLLIAMRSCLNVSVEDSSTFFARGERSSTKKSQTFVATGSCLFYHCLAKHKQKNDCAQHNKFGMSFVGQVVWDTAWASVFFSFGILFFFRAPA